MFFQLLLLFVTSSFLLACSHLPSSFSEKNLSDFIPISKETEEVALPPIESFYFAENMFPKECDWEILDSVIDGDTIRLNDGMKVRFIGIDTPESKDERKPIQRGALEATKTTQMLLEDSEKVCLISDPLSDEFDLYNRRLAYVFTESGIDVNAELLRRGKARGLFYFPFTRNLEFEAYLQMAQMKQVGLWASDGAR